MFEDPQHRLIAGIAMLVAAALIAVLAVVMGYAGITRWLAIDAIQESAIERFGDKERAAQMAAENAAKWAPNAPSAVLPGIDPLDPDSDELLAALERRAEPARHRDAVRVARELGRLARGEEFDGSSASGIDGSMLQHISELRLLQNGPLPSMPEPGRYESPNIRVLRFTVEERLRAAWRTAATHDFIASCGMLLQLDPQHPVARHAHITTHLFHPELRPTLIERQARNLEPDLLIPFARLLARLAIRHGGEQARARAHSILEEIPLKERNAEELRLWLQTGGHGLETLIRHARQSDDRSLILMAVARAIESGKVDSVKALLDKLPEQQRKQVQLHIAQQDWDLARIAAIDGEQSPFLPSVRKLRREDGQITFHVCNDFGASPDKLTVELGDNAAAISRAGSLITCDLPAERPLRLQVSLAGRSLFSEVVAR